MTIKLNRRQALGGGAVALAAITQGLAPAAAAPRATATAAAGPRRRAAVIGHRGCPFLRPENTLGAFAKAIADGADYIEFDLVPTSDGAIVVRHGNEISPNTDVADHPEFADRHKSQFIYEKEWTGWFTDDFTLAELKTLRGFEPVGDWRREAQTYNGWFQIPTFEEVIDFVAAEAAAHGRVIGLVPEIEFSTHFAARGLPLDEKVAAALKAHEYTRFAPVEILSFEATNLRNLRDTFPRSGNVRLTQLIADRAGTARDDTAANGKRSYGEMITPEGLRGVASYADGISVVRDAIIPRNPDGSLAGPTSLVADAHAAGLHVHAWTFYSENGRLAANFRNHGPDHERNIDGSVAELRQYLAQGIDGVTVDDPAVARRAVDGE